MQNLILILAVIQISQLGTIGKLNSAVRVTSKDPEDETLISGKLAFGWFGGPVVKFTEIHDQFAVLMGGQGGFIINHALIIGGGGYGLVNDIEVNDIVPGEDRLLDLGYGGMVLGYVIRSQKLVHLSVHSLIGGGRLSYREDYYSPWYDDVFFVVEPSLDLMLNVSKHFRIGLGGSYRFVNGIDLGRLNNSDIKGPSASLVFKLGRF